MFDLDFIPRDRPTMTKAARNSYSVFIRADEDFKLYSRFDAAGRKSRIATDDFVVIFLWSN